MPARINTTPKRFSRAWWMSGTISLEWWLNYAAFVSVLVAILLQLYLDHQDIRSGTTYVLLNFLTNLLFAYLTSWTFLKVMNYKEHREAGPFFRRHLHRMFTEYAEIIMRHQQIHDFRQIPFDASLVSDVYLAVFDRHMQVPMNEHQRAFHLRMMYNDLVSLNTRILPKIQSLRERRYNASDEFYIILSAMEQTLVRYDSSATKELRYGMLGYDLHLFVRDIARLERAAISSGHIKGDFLQNVVLKRYSFSRMNPEIRLLSKYRDIKITTNTEITPMDIPLLYITRK
jgi:hypothetical protein